MLEPRSLRVLGRPVYTSSRAMTAVGVARPPVARNFRFKFQTAKRPRSRATARGGLLVFSPRTSEGRRSAERRIATSRGLSPGSPGDSNTRQRLSALRRGVLKPWSVLPGTWQPSAISRRSPVPVQPAHSGRPLLSGPDGHPGPPESVLARHVPRRRIRPAWVTPTPAKLSLCPTSGSPLEAPPHWTGRKEYKPSRKERK